MTTTRRTRRMQRARRREFRPTDLRGCMFWLDAERVPHVSDGVAVSRWPDLARNGYDAVQNTDSNQPIWENPGSDSPAAIRGDGTNHWMSIDRQVQPATFELFCVIDMRLITQTQFANRSWILSNFASNSGFGLFQESGGYTFFVNCAGGSDEITAGGIARTYRQILSVRYDGADMVMEIDGEEVERKTHANGGDVAYPNDPTPRLMVQSASPDDPMHGKSQAFSLFDRPLTSGERKQVTSFLDQRNRRLANPVYLVTWLPGENQADSEQIYGDSYQVNFTNMSGQAAEALVTVDRLGTLYQLVCFWGKDDRNALVIGRRNLNSGSTWSWWVYDARGNLPTIRLTHDDNHNAAVVGVSTDGLIHIMYDMHGGGGSGQLKYRRSASTVENFDGGLGAEQSSLVNADNEDAVTYPTFFTDPAGELYLLFRDGASGDGDLYMYHWNVGSSAWEAAAGTSTDGLLIDGRNSTGTRSPYWSIPPIFEPDFGSGGLMHLFFNWRMAKGSDQNEDVCYIAWDGANFKKSNGTNYTAPITDADAEVAEEVPAGNGLFEVWGSGYSDSSGNPFACYIRDDSNGNAQVFVAWHDGSSWQVKQLTDLMLGSQPGAMSRYARVLIDRGTDTAHVIYRLRDEIRLISSGAGDYTSWAEKTIWRLEGASDANPTATDPVADMRPIGFDPYQWEQNRKWQCRLMRGLNRA